jgi:hypothetical protein
MLEEQIWSSQRTERDSHSVGVPEAGDIVDREGVQEFVESMNSLVVLVVLVYPYRVLAEVQIESQDQLIAVPSWVPRGAHCRLFLLGIRGRARFLRFLR